MIAGFWDDPTMIATAKCLENVEVYDTKTVKSCSCKKTGLMRKWEPSGSPTVERKTLSKWKSAIKYPERRWRQTNLEGAFRVCSSKGSRRHCCIYNNVSECWRIKIHNRYQYLPKYTGLASHLKKSPFFSFYVISTSSTLKSRIRYGGICKIQEYRRLWVAPVLETSIHL